MMVKWESTLNRLEVREGKCGSSVKDEWTEVRAQGTRGVVFL